MVPVIKDSFIYADKNQLGVEQLVVEVTLRPALVAKLGISDMQAFLDYELAKFNETVYEYEKVARIIIRTEDFPRTGSMKIIRKKTVL